MGVFLVLIFVTVAWAMRADRWEAETDQNSIKRAQRGLPEPPIDKIKFAQPNRRERAVFYTMLGSKADNPYAYDFDAMLRERVFIWGKEERLLQIMAKQSKVAMSWYMGWIMTCAHIEARKAKTRNDAPRWVRMLDALLPEQGFLSVFDEQYQAEQPDVPALADEPKPEEPTTKPAPLPPSGEKGAGTAPPRGMNEKFF